MASSIIIKNNTQSDILISDIGLILKEGDTIDLLDFGFSRADISSSKDLAGFIFNESIIVNNGIKDLSAVAGIQASRIDTIYEDDKKVTSLPLGGKLGQILIKNSDSDYDVSWVNAKGITPHEDIILTVNHKFEEHHWETGLSYRFEGENSTGEIKLIVINYSVLHDNNGKGFLRIRQGNKNIIYASDLQGSDVLLIAPVNVSSKAITWKIQGKVSKKAILKIGTITLRF